MDLCGSGGGGGGGRAGRRSFVLSVSLLVGSCERHRVSVERICKV